VDVAVAAGGDCANAFADVPGERDGDPDVASAVQAPATTISAAATGTARFTGRIVPSRRIAA
jgi:hypothetical protein